MSNVCPQCRSEWDSKTLSREGYTISPCARECGLFLSPGHNYVSFIGPYTIYWYPYVENETGECRVWWNRDDLVYVGANLPFDVSEDMIKLYLTFQ